MPPVTGKFQADFKSFYDAVEKGQVMLRSFEGDSSKVEKQLNRMADGFSGRRVIQEATLMAEAIKDTGGITRLTASELQRAGMMADEAAEKMRKLGMDVPPGIDRISKAAREARPEIGDLRGTVSQFDGVLNALGLNINRQVKAIEEIGAVSGKTAGQVGVLGTAGLVLGAGMAGWGFGRMIAEATGADNAITKLTARVLGYGDVSKEVLAAQSDVIARAFFNGAKATISYADAIKFNAEAMKNASIASIDWEQRLNTARAFVLDLTQEEIRQIQIARDLGASQEELKIKFGLTGDAVKALDDLLSKTSANEQKLAAVQKQLADNKLKAIEAEGKAAEQNAKKFANLAQENLAIELSMTGTKQEAKAAAIEAEFQREVAKLNKLDKEYQKYYGLLEEQRNLRLERESAHFDRINAMSRASLEERAEDERKTLEIMQARSGQFSAAQIAQQKETWFAAQEAVRNFGLGAEATLTSVAEKAKEEAARITAFMNAATLNDRDSFSVTSDIPRLTGFALDAVVNRFRQAGDTDPEKALWRAMDQLSAQEGRVKPTDNASFFQLQRDTLLLAQLRQMLSGKERPKGFFSGVENFEGGLAYVHKDEALVHMPKGTSVIPASRSGAMGGMNVTVNVNAGLGDRMTIAKAIKDVLVAEFKSYGYRGAAPFGA